MDTFPHWWDGWVITNAPAALESPGTLSGLATTDKGVLTAWNNALKILEDYHTTGAVAQARRLQTEAKVWSDLFAARNKLEATAMASKSKSRSPRRAETASSVSLKVCCPAIDPSFRVVTLVE